MKLNWISPRIWRSPWSRFTEDEPLNAVSVYTPETLGAIRDQGFDAIWMRGRLGELSRSTVYPELNDARAPERIVCLQRVIEAGMRQGVSVFLYFNEPLALPRTHPFWTLHPELRGEPWAPENLNRDDVSFCTSTREFQAYFDESARNLFADLKGLGGVILITASEMHTHCWSHKALRRIGDPYLDACLTPMTCPRCKQREPADVVAELVSVWTRNAAAVSPIPQVWAWNWSWSMWYAQPQEDVIDRLPRQTRLLLDFERGATRRQDIGEVAIDEYALGYVGPSERFEGARRAAGQSGRPVCAKVQLGTTHELATVPNLPLIPNLFLKLSRINAMGLDGMMGSWNFGNAPSLNTAAFGLFVRAPSLRCDVDAFCITLAAEQFPAAKPERIVAAWKAFCDAFHEYPFSIPMLYHGPMNYAVATALERTYQDRPMGPSWIAHFPFGDRIEDCLNPFSPSQVSRCLALMQAHWTRGLALYDEANGVERDCATMIGLHIAAAGTFFAYHGRRRALMEAHALTGSCQLPEDAMLTQIRSRHRTLLRQAEPIARRNSSFGFHQEPGQAFYTADLICSAIAKTKAADAHP